MKSVFFSLSRQISLKSRNPRDLCRPVSFSSRSNFGQSFWSHRNFASTSVQVPVSSNPKIVKSYELLVAATNLVGEGKLKEARPMLETALDLLKRFDGNLKGKEACSIYQNLGFVYHHLGQLERAEDFYKQSIEGLTALFGSNHRDVGLVYLNYAELLQRQGKSDWDSYGKRGIEIISQYHTDDTFLAASLSNYASYLYAAKKFSDARAPAIKALRIFIREFGKNNEYTRACFGNLYNILNKLGLQQEIKELEKVWDIIDQNQVPGITPQQLSEISEHFEHTIKKAEPKANPDGPVKGPKLYKHQIQEFFSKVLPDSGANPYDPATIPILVQEVEAMKKANLEREKLSAKLKARREFIVRDRMSHEGEQAVIKEREREESSYLEAWRIFKTEEKYTRQFFDKAGLTGPDQGVQMGSYELAGIKEDPDSFEYFERSFPHESMRTEESEAIVRDIADARMESDRDRSFEQSPNFGIPRTDDMELGGPDLEVYDTLLDPEDFKNFGEHAGGEPGDVDEDETLRELVKKKGKRPETDDEEDEEEKLEESVAGK